jgi:hypothetical protein
MFLWGSAEICERVQYIAEKQRSVWEFIMSPGGSVCLVVAGLLSIIGVIVWPDAKKHFERVRKFLGPSTDERLESLEGDIETVNTRWIDEAGARSHLATSTRDTITGLSKRIDELEIEFRKQLDNGLANNRHWTDSVNGKVGDLKEQVAILITDYLKRQEGKL